MLEALGEVSQVRVFRAGIAQTVRLQESALQGVPVQVSAPGSNAARAYRSLTEEIIESAGERLPAPSARLHAVAGSAAVNGTRAAEGGAVETEPVVADAGAPSPSPVEQGAAMAAVEQAHAEPQSVDGLDTQGADPIPEMVALTVAGGEPEAAVAHEPDAPVRLMDSEEPATATGAEEAEPEPAASRGHRFRLFRRARAS
jgi:hypothetical protein